MKQLKLLATIFFITVPTLTLARDNSRRVSAENSKKQESLLAELTGKDISKESDRDLYAEMVSAYDKNDKVAFKIRLQSLLQRFPNSNYADNALFLAGRMAVDNNDFATAIKSFSKIEKQYPNSNKIVSAKFAKAMTYKKMNLPEFALKSLNEVKAKYPGSPESLRASSEIKLIK